MNYAKHVSTKATPQTEPIPRSNQVKNEASGYSFPLDDWKRLDRFVILGSAGGTYYANERKLTRENAAVVERLLSQDAKRTIDRIVEISEAGRAPNNDPALFALSLAMSSKSVETRQLAYAVLPRVARIGTHFFHLLDYVNELRGWSKGLRKAIANWYESKKPEELAYQVIKYRQRDGWTHRDALRLAHPTSKDASRQALYRWMVTETLGEREVKRGKGEQAKIATYPAVEGLPELIGAYTEAQTAPKERLLELIRKYRLPREALPTDSLNKPEVWEALLESMPMEAMVRNLATMTRVGLLEPRSDASKSIVGKLSSEKAIWQSRLHPIKVLAALLTYQQGHGERGQNTWTPVQQVVDALDGAFYIAFGNVVPTGKQIMLALDVSGSMDGGTIAGVPGLTPRVGAAAMALVTARVEPNYELMAFSHTLIPFNVSPRERLDDVAHKMAGTPMGGTDCALPMLYAMKQKQPVDAFCVYTDSETWAGRYMHPMEALRAYRKEKQTQSKLIVVGMTANEFTIGDPEDAGCLDIAGFDTATPQVISDFISE